MLAVIEVLKFPKSSAVSFLDFEKEFLSDSRSTLSCSFSPKTRVSAIAMAVIMFVSVGLERSARTSSLMWIWDVRRLLLKNPWRSSIDVDDGEGSLPSKEFTSAKIGLKESFFIGGGEAISFVELSDF